MIQFIIILFIHKLPWILIIMRRSLHFLLWPRISQVQSTYDYKWDHKNDNSNLGFIDFAPPAKFQISKMPWICPLPSKCVWESPTSIWLSRSNLVSCLVGGIRSALVTTSMGTIMSISFRCCFSFGSFLDTTCSQWVPLLMQWHFQRAKHLWQGPPECLFSLYHFILWEGYLSVQLISVQLP